MRPGLSDGKIFGNTLSTALASLIFSTYSGFKGNPKPLNSQNTALIIMPCPSVFGRIFDLPFTVQ
jgi:hypothetical protein